MIKRLLLTATLALATVSIADVAVASAPFPGCYPCPPLPPEIAQSLVAAEAR